MNFQSMKKHNTHQSKFTETCLHYADLLKADQLSEMEIDSVIEELRPVRMWFHAFKYGDAPGFRPHKNKDNNA